MSENLTGLLLDKQPLFCKQLKIGIIYILERYLLKNSQFNYPSLNKVFDSMRLISSITKTLKLALVTGLALSSFSSYAAQVPVDNYIYQTSFNSSYPDSGGELTDGVTFSPAWGGGSAISYSDVAPLVGWLNTDPSVLFEFASTSFIDEIIIYAADSDGAAGVGLPSSINILAPGTGFNQNFAVTNPAGAGSTVPIVISGLNLNTASIVVTASRVNSWTMFSEVQFFDSSSVTVATPSSALLIALGGIALFATRRKSKSKA